MYPAYLFLSLYKYYVYWGITPSLPPSSPIKQNLKKKKKTKFVAILHKQMGIS